MAKGRCVECGTPAQHDVVALAWLAIFLYPIGLLVLTAMLLIRAREAVVARRPTPLSSAISFLHREYEPHMWWWELIEMLRRLLLVGLMQIMVESGSALQIVLGTVFSVVFLLFQVQSSPYVSLHDDHLSSSCSFALSTIFLTSIGSSTRRSPICVTSREDECGAEPGVCDGLVLLRHAALPQHLWCSDRLHNHLHTVCRRETAVRAKRSRPRRVGCGSSRPRRRPSPAAPGWPTWLKPDECAPNRVGPSMCCSRTTGHKARTRCVSRRGARDAADISALDVDALGNTCFKDFEHIDMSNTVLIFLTEGFLRSGPCAKELVRAVLLEKPIIAVLESDPHRGGLTQAKVVETITAVKETAPHG